LTSSFNSGVENTGKILIVQENNFFTFVAKNRSEKFNK